MTEREQDDDVFDKELADEGHAIVIVPAETWWRAKKEQEQKGADVDEGCE